MSDQARATEHARHLLTEHGATRAVEIVVRKVADAPFLVTAPGMDGIGFWRMVAHEMNNMLASAGRRRPRRLSQCAQGYVCRCKIASAK